jgi:hypothetical protein
VIETNGIQARLPVELVMRLCKERLTALESVSLENDLQLDPREFWDRKLKPIVDLKRYYTSILELLSVCSEEGYVLVSPDDYIRLSIPIPNEIRS